MGDYHSWDIAAWLFGVSDKLEKLEEDLLKIPHITKVDFDLDGFLDDIKQVIFVLKYDIPADTENYFGERNALINSALDVAAYNGLSRTDDAIEDHGEHFYFVTKCDDTWKKIAEDEPEDNDQQKPNAKDSVTGSVRSVAGFNIMSAIRINENTEIVMGQHNTSYGVEYATWECTDGDDYNWGHYGFKDPNAALADMCERAADKFRFQVSEQSNFSEDASEEDDGMEM